MRNIAYRETAVKTLEPSSGVSSQLFLVDGII